MICFSLKSLIALIDDEISVKSQKTATAVLYLGNSIHLGTRIWIKIHSLRLQKGQFIV